MIQGATPEENAISDSHDKMMAVYAGQHKIMCT